MPKRKPLEISTKTEAVQVAQELIKLNEEIYNLDSEVIVIKRRLRGYAFEVENLEGEISVKVAFDPTLTNERQRDAARNSLRLESERLKSLSRELIPNTKEDISIKENQRSVMYRHYSILLAYLQHLRASQDSLEAT